MAHYCWHYRAYALRCSGFTATRPRWPSITHVALRVRWLGTSATPSKQTTFLSKAPSQSKHLKLYPEPKGGLASISWLLFEVVSTYSIFDSRDIGSSVYAMSVCAGVISSLKIAIAFN